MDQPLVPNGTPNAKAAILTLQGITPGMTTADAQILATSSQTWATLAVADAIQNAANRDPADTWKTFTQPAQPGETPAIRLIVCDCGAQNFARYPVRRNRNPVVLDWWVCSNPSCRLVWNMSEVPAGGSKIPVVQGTSSP